MERFKASTQYGDWEGTAAADEQPSSIRKWLESNGLIKSSEFLVAVSLYVSEHEYNSPYLRAFVFQGEKHESVKNALDTTKGAIPVRSIEVKLTTEQFLELFKRFSVMLTWQGLQLEGREYSDTNN
jgi:hypothetical protein